MVRWFLCEGRYGNIHHSILLPDNLLNQFTANSLGIPVKSGPVEATALGSILMQMKADGEIQSLQDGRALVENSFATQTFEPHDSERWKDALDSYKSTLNIN